MNDPPVAPVEFAQEVSKRVEEGGVLTYQVPVFKDEEDDAAKQSIEYEAKLVVVGQNGLESLLDIPYDDWIAFDEATRTFRFTPSESRHKGVYTVRVFARDTSDVETFVEFKLTVGEFNDAPVASALVAQKVVEDTPSTYAFDAFTDEETSTLTYSHTVERVVSGVKTAVSPKWIEFDEATLTFKFTPSDSSHAGKYEVTVKGEDAGIGGDDSTRKSVSEKFVLTVDEFNDAPVASALKDHLLTDAVVEDTEITYKFDAFTDEETSPLAYSYTVVRIEDDDSKTDVSPLWIDFDDDPHDDQGNLNPTFRTFTFKPDKSWHAGTYEVTVKGEDAGIPGKPKKSISAEFELEVKAVNDRPVVPEEFSEEVLQGEEVRRGVEEGTDVPYRVPAFTDEENDRAGAPLAYSYTVVRLATNGDETAVSVSEIEQWVDFDDDPVSADFRTFMFSPSESRHKGVYRVRVFAQDTSGAKTSVQFRLTVGEFNDVPVASSLVGRTVVEDVASTDPTSIYPCSDAFTDEETSALTYAASWAAEGTENDAGEKVFVDLPEWIVFGAVDGDATKMQFAFKPHKSWHAGKHTLRVVGTDEGIGGDDATKKSDFAEFVLEVVDFNDAPVAGSLAAHTVQEDVDKEHASATYPVPKFTDEEDDAALVPLTYTFEVVRVGDDGIETAVSASDWVDFDADSSSATFRTFTFTPHRSWHAGKYKVRVKGEDAGIGGGKPKKSAIAEFMLTVGAFNDVPVASSLVGRTVVEDVASTYVFDAFTDEEEDKASRSLSYTAFWAARDSTGRDIVDGDGEKTFVPLPRWIVFDGSARKFTFKPHRSWDAGRYTLRVVGTDEGIPGKPAAKSASAEFVLEVLDFNDAPVASTLTRPAGR